MAGGRRGVGDAKLIGVAEAREFFAHPSQLRASGIESPDDLPETGFEYWACGPICGAFHMTAWPGVWMAHYGAKPEGWGRLVPHARACLHAFAAARRPLRIVGWTSAGNRHAVAFARRIGFEEDGRMPLPGGDVILSGWRP